MLHGNLHIVSLLQLQSDCSCLTVKVLLRLTYKTMCLLPVTGSCSHGHSAKFSQRFWNQSLQWRFWVVLNDTISSSNLKNKTFQFSNTVLVSTFARSHNSRTESSLDVYSSKNSRGWASITGCQKIVSSQLGWPVVCPSFFWMEFLYILLWQKFHTSYGMVSVSSCEVLVLAVSVPVEKSVPEAYALRAVTSNVSCSWVKSLSGAGSKMVYPIQLWPTSSPTSYWSVFWSSSLHQLQ